MCCLFAPFDAGRTGVISRQDFQLLSELVSGKRNRISSLARSCIHSGMQRRSRALLLAVTVGRCAGGCALSLSPLSAIEPDVPTSSNFIPDREWRTLFVRRRRRDLRQLRSRVGLFQSAHAGGAQTPRAVSSL